MSEVPAGATVDAASRCVRLGEEAWTFELDLRDGVATLDLDGGRARLRPLLWREKVRLARFAGVGGGVLEGQFLGLSAIDGLDSGLEETEREALVALALWLNAPDGDGAAEPGLPLETSLLAVVTLEVCRAMGLTPADLDGREAPEVEALWHVAAASGEMPAVHRPAAFGGEPAGSDAATTRILVVPDSPAAAAAVGEAAAASAAAAVEPAPGATAGAGSMPSNTVLQGSEGAAHRAVEERRVDLSAASEGMRGSRRAGRSRRSVDRFRFFRPEELVETSVAPAEDTFAPQPAPVRRRRAPVAAGAEPVGMRSPERPESAPLAAPAPARSAAAEDASHSADPVPSPLAAGSAGARGRETSVPAPATAGLAAAERESLLEELGRRLELAAAELGIDTET